MPPLRSPLSRDGLHVRKGHSPTGSNLFSLQAPEFPEPKNRFQSRIRCIPDTPEFIYTLSHLPVQSGAMNPL